jgi:hypothetical protein
VQNGGLWMSFVGETNVAANDLLAPGEEGWMITGLGTVTNDRAILASGRFGGSTITQLVRMIPVIPEDITGDGSVGADDLAQLLAAWGTPGPGDFDGDGVVGASDLGLLLAAWSA